MNFDELSRRAMLVIGVVLLGLGVLTMVLIEPLVSIFPSNYVPVVIAGGLAFLLGIWMARNRYRATFTQTELPAVELPLSTPAPGHDIDVALYRLTELRQGTTEYKNQIQERLGEVAVSVIRQRENCSREQAVNQLEEGDWTTNQSAAGFFTGGSPPSLSLSERLFGSDETAYERWVKTTVDAIGDRAKLESATEPERAVQDEESSLLDRLLPGESEEGSAPAQTSYQAQYDDSDADRVGENILYKPTLTTGEWTGITAFAFIAAGWGVITFNPALLLASVVGVAFAAYARAATPPALAALDVERHIDEDNPQPGEPVEVTVTVENTGGSFLPDVRLVDRVPGPMEVVDGSPRLGTAIGAGSTATFSYTVIAERGTHEWPLVAVGRDFSGAVEREALVEVDATLECVPSLKTVNDMPVRSQTSLYSGEIDTSVGGSGLEFFSVREYREGDPMNRIDWKRHARTGELATIDFRQERAAQVVLLFDARDSAYVSPNPGDHHAVDRSVDAAAEVFASLHDRGDLVGLAAFDTVPCWLGPGAGDGHRERARQMFAGHPAMSSIPPEYSETEGHYVDPMLHVRRQLSPEAQIMLFSPLCDDYTATVARRLDSAGHPVTIISPDPTADRTVGQQLARVEREMRVARLRERGIRVIDWPYDEVLGLEIERAQQRWAV